MLDRQAILIGYSGHGYVVADIAIENNYQIIGYSEKAGIQKNPFNLEYLGDENQKDFIDAFWNKCYFLIGIGDNILRERIFKNLIDKGCHFLTLKSLSSSISNTAVIENGTFINRNVSVNAFSRIGKNVILNTACIIEHDCIISDSVHIAPGAVLAGNVFVGERTFVGANCVIKQGIKIGNDVLIGAGAVIIKDIPNGEVVVGNPGHSI